MLNWFFVLLIMTDCYNYCRELLLVSLASSSSVKNKAKSYALSFSQMIS